MSIEIRKQVSFYLPLSQWKALVREAARLKVPMTALIQRWIAPHIESLTKPLGKEDEGDRAALGD